MYMLINVQPNKLQTLAAQSFIGPKICICICIYFIYLSFIFIF